MKIRKKQQERKISEHTTLLSNFPIPWGSDRLVNSTKFVQRAEKLDSIHFAARSGVKAQTSRGGACATRFEQGEEKRREICHFFCQQHKRVARGGIDVQKNEGCQIRIVPKQTKNTPKLHPFSTSFLFPSHEKVVYLIFSSVQNWS